MTVWYAIGAIILIATLVEVYPPLGYGLALLAVMGMIVTYYSGSQKGVPT